MRDLIIWRSVVAKSSPEFLFILGKPEVFLPLTYVSLHKIHSRSWHEYTLWSEPRPVRDSSLLYYLLKTE